MKINKAKLLVGTLAIASVAATVGSISGTVAWFQYSTRSTIAYSGAAAHVSENLQIRLYKHYDAVGETPAYEHKTEWKTDLSIADVHGFIKAERNNTEDYNLRPITSGNLAENKVATSFYKSPVYQYSHFYDDEWQEAEPLDYVELPIQLRVLDNNGEATEEFLGNKPIYLSDLTIASEAVANKKNITEALRVSFDTADKDVTFSKNGGTVATSGKLDLNGDNELDKTAGYEFQQRADFIYGGTKGENDNDGNPTHVDSFEVTTKPTKSTATAATLLADDSDPTNILGTALGSTGGEDNIFALTVRIYLEGWQEFITDQDALDAADKDHDFANKAAIVAAKEAQESPLQVADGDSFLTADGHIYKWVEASNDFVEVEYKNAVWDSKDYVEAAFNVGMRFSTTLHAEH